MVLDRLIDRYCDFLRYEQRASPATCQQRYYALRRLYWFLAGLFGRENIKVEEVQQQHLRSYLNYLHNQGCKPSTIGHVVTVVKALFRFAVAKKILRKNPAARLRKPRVPKREKPYLKPGEVEALFLAVEPGEANWRRNLTILLTFYYTGIRLEELLNLRLEDLSPDCSELRIVRGKGDKSRLLPVHPVLQEALRLYLAKERVGGEGEYLFTTRKGRPLSRSTVYQLVKKYAWRAGLEVNVTPHILRHTFATHLHQNKVDIYRISALLGHSNIENTAIYTHTDDALLREAVLKL
ncbi:MAG TPA: tyrosine-type recombinase/integrase [Firmicutes bacterium]|nr:tyrosine-type recombinase/integrase [Bacillota bacterium]